MEKTLREKKSDIYRQMRIGEPFNILKSEFTISSVRQMVSNYNVTSDETFSVRDEGDHAVVFKKHDKVETYLKYIRPSINGLIKMGIPPEEIVNLALGTGKYIYDMREQRMVSTDKPIPVRDPINVEGWMKPVRPTDILQEPEPSEVEYEDDLNPHTIHVVLENYTAPKESPFGEEMDTEGADDEVQDWEAPEQSEDDDLI